MSVDSDRGGQAPPQTSELWQPPNLGKPASEILRLDPRSKRWTFAGLKALLVLFAAYLFLAFVP
jgi:hypothetical protein